MLMDHADPGGTQRHGHVGERLGADVRRVGATPTNETPFDALREQQARLPLAAVCRATTSAP